MNGTKEFQIIIVLRVKRNIFKYVGNIGNVIKSSQLTMDIIGH